MIFLTRLLKRSQHHLFVVLAGLLLCSWLFLGLERAATAASRPDPHNDRSRRPLGRGRMSQALPGVSKAGSSTNKIVHSRLNQRPQPGHASQANFPNVPVQIRLPDDDGSHITTQEVQDYIQSIWDLADTKFWRTECDTQSRFPKRYEILRDLADRHTTSQVKYFFALDLFQVRSLLPRLMGTLVQVFKQLGPEKCAISVIEGRSEDGTYAVLLALKEKLKAIGVRFYLSQSDINPHADGVDRIGALSELRNMAIKPMITESANSTGPPTYNTETILIFVNDISVCTEDVYELLFQHVFQSAHQTCAMDYVFGGDVYYDSWVARGIHGDLFFEVPQDVSFAFAENMFWNHPLSKEKFKNHQPFQVYSCWGGMVTLNSAPFISGQVQFRNSTENECYAGEPTNLAKDLWKLGYGKVLTVPTVNVGYDSAETSRIKKRRGWVHTHVEVDKTEEEWKGTELILWQAKPPGQVKCMPSWGVTSWTDP